MPAGSWPARDISFRTTSRITQPMHQPSDIMLYVMQYAMPLVLFLHTIFCHPQTPYVPIMFAHLPNAMRLARTPWCRHDHTSPSPVLPCRQHRNTPCQDTMSAVHACVAMQQHTWFATHRELHAQAGCMTATCACHAQAGMSA